jgi:hypothetical protein
MTYREAQNFYWDSASFAGATEAALAKVEVYVRARPSANNNRSGILDPGATMFVVPTVNSIPLLDNINDAPRARLEYSELFPSTDANTKSAFKFDPPVSLPTNKEYSFILHYDGDEDYILWRDVKGELMTGTTQVSPGHPVKDVGKYFVMGTAVPTPTPNNTPIGSSNTVYSNSLSNTQTGNTSYNLANWQPKADTALKFTVYAARYAFNGDRNLNAYVNAVATPPNTVIVTPSNAVHNTTTGCVVFRIPVRRYEYILFDHRRSFWKQVMVGERCFHRRPFYPHGGSPRLVSISLNSAICTSANGNINFRDLFLLGGQEREHIVIWSRDHDGSGRHRCQVREVVEIISNTSIRLDSNCTFTNAICYFHRSPVGTIDAIQEIIVEGRREQMVILRDTCANLTHRFANHCFESVTITANGTGYSNSDYITFTGFEHISGIVEGGTNAVANIVTNGNGSITAVHLNELGCGFVNTAAISYAVSNSTGGASAGSGATFSVNVGSIFCSEFLGQDGRGGHFHHCRMHNIDLDECGWVFDMHHPSGSFFDARHRLCYYSKRHDSSHNRRRYHCDDDDGCDHVHIKDREFHRLRHVCTKRRCFPSWSNELIICWEANGSICNGAGGSGNSVTTVPPGTSNASVLIINTVANGDYSSVLVAPSTTTTTFSQYIINDDYTDEHTNAGNAFAKGIETKVTFANDHFAEDVRVFLTAYRPANTDIQVYFRIHNSDDPEAFDDKDWTRLELKDGANVFSSPTVEDDFVELTYGFQSCPNVAYTLDGSVTLELNNAQVVGVGTTISSNLANGDLVKIYQPLFPNTHIIALVNVATNATHMVLETAISNNDLVGPGLKVQKIAYPHQAFNNYLNDNVVRYYNTSKVEFDTFNSYQIKTVLLSANNLLVPRVDDIRMAGVSS